MIQLHMVNIMAKILQEMVESKESYNVAWLEYKQESKKAKDTYFCFFEGEDRKFYLSYIEQRIGKINTYNCGGRDAVITLSKKLTSEEKCLFFVDADYHLYTKEVDINPKIFQTNKYSIESYFLESSSFKYILKYTIGINENNKHFNRILENFEKRKSDFLALNIDYTVYSVACVINNLKSNLKKFEFNKYFCVKYDSVTPLQNINELCESVNELPINDIANNEFKKTYEKTYKYIEKNIDYFIRGKNYELFLVHYLKELRNYFKKEQELLIYSKTFPKKFNKELLLAILNNNNEMTITSELDRYFNKLSL